MREMRLIVVTKVFEKRDNYFVVHDFLYQLVQRDVFSTSFDLVPLRHAFITACNPGSKFWLNFFYDNRGSARKKRENAGIL